MSTRQYIGDGVYCDVENGVVKLYTAQGDLIYMEPEVIKNFLDWLKTVQKDLS